jgi:long-chain fatty acid transport protein
MATPVSTTRPGRRAPGIALAALALVAPLVASPAAAQTSLQVPLQFDFLNPGAKSLAMGGAFAGLADDATATLANPAGLIQLSQREISIEGRFTAVDTAFLEGGRISGQIFNQGIDTVAGPVFGTSEGRYARPTFISVVSPFRSNRWVVAAHRHELVRVDQQFFSTGVFQQDPSEFTSRRSFPQQGDRQLTITSYGGSVAFAPRSGLALGAGLTLHRFSIDSVFTRYGTVGFLGPPLLSEVRGRSSQNGDDTGLAPSVGLMVGTGGRTRMGALYRHGSTFQFTTVDGLDPARDVTFQAPHTFAVGLSHRPRPSILLAAEVTRIFYERLEDEFVTDQARGAGRANDFHIDSGTEVHLGAQYLAFQWKWAPKFRLGAWYDPNHSVRFRPAATPTTAFDRTFDELLRTSLSKGENRVHATGGLGLSLTPRLEWNAGVDIASGSYIISTSLILRAGTQ